jgi:hypothetical protein
VAEESLARPLLAALADEALDHVELLLVGLRHAIDQERDGGRLPAWPILG